MHIKGFFLLLLGVHIQSVFAAPWEARIKERDDSIALSSTTTSTSPSISSGAKDPEGSNESFTATSTTAYSQRTSSSMTTLSSSTAMLTSTASAPSISGAATSVFVTGPTFNSTITPGQLPLQPKITPGFAIVGVILIATGALYTFIGIKNKWLHISLSTGYLVSVAITVLILYVMNLPVSNSVQGAYVVAIVLPGFIIGGCSLIFAEMAEGLGCLLGGFCFSMWLLVMKAGGLLTSTSGISVLIALISIAAFSLSFSHYTRTYGLIVCISFAGSTAIVLGIDCFSRAGLKEFWAYIWNLNSNLFPLGATTYPVTKGIRVEIAAIFIIFLAGIVSQSKLHKMILDRRAQRMAERQENKRVLEEEEMNVAKSIEDQNVAEKERWERIYGEKVGSGDESTRDSALGDMESSKRGPASTVTSIGELDGTEIEMSDISSPTRPNGAGLVTPNENGQDGAITVRVAQDIEPKVEQNEDENSVPSHQLSQGSDKPQATTSLAEDGVWVIGADGEAHHASRPSRQLSNRISTRAITATPEVVPLPFQVPENELEDNRSSIATLPDEELAAGNRGSRRISSGGSALIERLYVRSKRGSQRYSQDQGISTEDLVIPYANEDDRASSVAATVDDLSEDEDMERGSLRSSFTDQDSPMPDAEFLAESQQIEQDLVLPSQTTAEPRDNLSGQTVSSLPMDLTSEGAHNKLASAVSGMRQSSELRPESGFTVATDILDPPRSEMLPKEPMQRGHSSTPSGNDAANTIQFADGENVEDDENRTESKFMAEPSVKSTPDIKTTTITKDRLPSQVSRVVISYRTNEWAKHLGHADSPQMEELNISDDITEDSKAESAAPVDVEALQQTAHSALPSPAPRSSAHQSNQPSGLTRSSSTQSNITPFKTIPENSSVHGHDVLTRNSSQQSPRGLAMHRSLRSTSNHNIPEPIVELPGRETTSSQRQSFQSNSSPFGNSNTLMGKRDTMLRNRSSYFPTTNSSPRSMAPTPEPTQSPLPHFQSASPSQMGSETGSIHGSLRNHHTSPSSPIMVSASDDMPLSQRRELIRQSTQAFIQPTTAFNSHQPRRQSGAPNPMVREQQLATWRKSVAHDLQAQRQREMEGVERQRSVLWRERKGEEQRRMVEERRRGEREVRRDEMMRMVGGGMEGAHRRLLGRMQDEARKVI
ncbi:hypothetical protein SBOR_5746 [Sclerotinia borealis F-4128]|uniref:TM7S3/TM198-like domain-containing protein n=1 Tax=Sclerotinia borealis (strain F-4128) TaxID=1432307 RepID=W9CDF3_SCLBF|nr:hypothetical protein SBOR_5746 [Sclerotinia borealis F-4128]